LRVLEQNRLITHLPYVGIHYRERENSVSDRYRKAGKLAAEVTQINLASLHRYRAAGGRLNGDLMENWWRLWRNWGVLKEQTPGAPDRGTSPGETVPAVETLTAPPLPVRAYGLARQWGWKARRVLVPLR
jgi:hypothetical protein